MTTPSSSWRVRALPLALFTACACSSAEKELFSEAPGSASFAIGGVDADITALEYVLRDNAGVVLESESLSPDAAGSLQFSLELPPAERYAILLTAHTADGASCTGGSEFNVSPSARVDVAVELQCSGGSGASVIGTLVSCPSVRIATDPVALDVGASLVLATAAVGTLAAAPTWTASAGHIETLDGTTRFTCSAPGDVEIRLSVGAADCSLSDSVIVSCTEPPSVSACDGLGSTCHVVDATSAEAHACHELGHGGDEAACAEGRASCIDTCGSALCSELGSLCHDVDPGSGPIHECHELGHAADAAACFAEGRACFELCTRAHYEPVSINFAAQVGAEPFACGSSYSDVGTPASGVEPQDFRFFVHDIRLITADASEVPVEIDERAPWQGPGTALLDFEDASGGCLSGDVATNTQVTGHVPPGEYVGIAFRIGVPEGANHGDPAVQPAPLAAGSMTWGWLSGYKFLRAELGSEAGGAVLHLGAAACSGDPAAGSVTCSRSNRPEISFAEFDPASDVIVADIAALFADSDLSESILCHSSGAPCGPPFARLGVDLDSGQSAPGQTVFRVAP
jgi:uncharacterized repeat protein (TIGR04052 family)